MENFEIDCSAWLYCYHSLESIPSLTSVSPPPPLISTKSKTFLFNAIRDCDKLAKNIPLGQQFKTRCKCTCQFGMQDYSLTNFARTTPAKLQLFIHRRIPHIVLLFPLPSSCFCRVNQRRRQQLRERFNLIYAISNSLPQSQNTGNRIIFIVASPHDQVAISRRY